jgi:hypothetical protein
VVVLLCLSGCTDALAESKQLALQAASTQVSKLQADADDLAGTSSSTRAFLSGIQAGDLGIVFASPLPAGTDLPGPTFTVIYDGTVNGDAVDYSAVVEATGESGGGGTYHQSSVFLCLSLSSRVGGGRETSVADTTCRPDILDLLQKRNGNTAIKLGDLPKSADS